MDVLASALEKFRFSKTVYGAFCTNRAPWGVALPASRSVHFHAVRAGSAWLRLAGEAPVQAEAGDFVVLPHGDAHEVCDARETPAAPVAQLLGESERATPWIMSFGRNGPRSVLVCAAFAGSSGDDPLLSFLPRVLHLRARETASLEPILALAEREMQASNPATEAVLTRLGEILMVEAVRAYLKTARPGESRWLGALHDPQLSSVLHAIHAEPARRWTIASLASQACMSRTALATRFRALLGTSVHAYLASVRMRAAALLLEDPKRPKLARVAAEVGYGSEAAFSRAFLREMGVAPTTLRPARAAKTPAERSA